MPEQTSEKRINRTAFLRRAGVAAAAVGVGGLTACGANEQQNSAALLATDTEATAIGYAPPQRLPLLCKVLSFFTAEEGATVDAITARFIPGSVDDPGAHEACVTGFIDHKLSSFQTFSVPTYFRAPFAKPVPKAKTGPQENAKTTILVAKTELDRYGFQSSSTPQDSYRKGIAALGAFTRGRHKAAFVDLDGATQDSVLALMEAFGPLPSDPAKAKTQLAQQTSPAGKALAKAFGKASPYGFFSMVLEDAYEGMFADPIYGGNHAFAGWLLVGYPGAQRAYTPKELTAGPHRRRVQGLADMPAMHPGNPAPHAILPISGTTRTEH